MADMCKTNKTKTCLGTELNNQALKIVEKFLHLRSATKYKVKTKKIKQKHTRPKNFDICFCVSFDHYSPKLFF